MHGTARFSLHVLLTAQILKRFAKIKYNFAFMPQLVSHIAKLLTVSRKLATTKHARLGFTEHIRVFVSAERRCFVVRKDVISRRSPFFKAAISKRWLKSKEADGVFELPEDDPDAFATYLQCVYRNAVVLSEGDSAVIFEHLVLLYAIADSYDDPITANLTIDAMLQYSDEIGTIPDAYHICLAYEVISDKSPLRQYMVDMTILETATDVLLEDPNAFPKAFLGSCLAEYAQLKGGAGNRSVDGVFRRNISKDVGCRYHQHNEMHPACEGSAVHGRAGKKD